MKIVNRIIIWVLLLVLPTLVLAANKKLGTTGAQFLKIGAGPRPTAMGNAFTGLADDVNAVYFNPAGLSYLNRPELVAMHTQWFQDMNYEFGAFSYPTDLGAFAISAATLKEDDLLKRGSDESLQGTFEASDAAYTLSYSRYFGPLTSIGMTGRYIQQKIDTTSAGTWGSDIGLLQRFGRYPVSLGVVAKNMGQEVKFQNESDPLPFSVNVGLGASLFRERLKFGLDAIIPRDNDIQLGAGSEFNVFLKKDLRFSVRGGYNQRATDADGSGLSFGGGVGFGHFNFDASWTPFGDLGNTFRYAIHVKF